MPEDLDSDWERVARFDLGIELIEGNTLQERLQCGPISVEEGLKVFHQIAAAVEAFSKLDRIETEDSGHDQARAGRIDRKPKYSSA